MLHIHRIRNALVTFRWGLSALLVTVLLGVALCGSCGGGAAVVSSGGSKGSGSGNNTITNTGTPIGSYSLTVTGTSGSLTHTETLPMVVQ